MSKTKEKLTEKEKQKKLLGFIDGKIFNPILKAKKSKYSEKDQETLEEVQKKTEEEKKKFQKDYKNSKEIKSNYLSNVNSEPAKKLNKKIKSLDLPTMPEYKDEFQELCEELDV